MAADLAATIELNPWFDLLSGGLAPGALRRGHCRDGSARLAPATEAAEEEAGPGCAASRRKRRSPEHQGDLSLAAMARSLAAFFGAQLPAMKHLAPVTLREVAHEDEGYTERRLVQASWERRESQDFAVGVVRSIVPAEVLEGIGPEALTAFCPVLGEATPSTMRTVEGEAVTGLMVRGNIDGSNHSGGAFCCVTPGGTPTVLCVVAAVKGRNGWVDSADLDSLVESTLTRGRIGGPESAVNLNVATRRASFELNSCVVESSGFVQFAACLESDGGAIYFEAPAGLFDIAELDCPIASLDSRGRFRFKKAFATSHRLRRVERHVEGLAGKLPMHVWQEPKSSGFVFVRDDVLYALQLDDVDEATANQAIDSFRFLPTDIDLLRLIDRQPIDLESMFVPMPPSFRELAKQGAR